MSYKHFSPIDRVKLSVLLKTDTEREEIGRILNKDQVSIQREIKRNSKDGKYLPSLAEKKSKQRKTHRKNKIENNLWLRIYITLNYDMSNHLIMTP